MHLGLVNRLVGLSLPRKSVVRLTARTDMTLDVYRGRKTTQQQLFGRRGWSGGAMVLDKLPVPGRPSLWKKSRARPYCTCGRCGWGLFGHFSLVYLSSHHRLVGCFGF